MSFKLLLLTPFIKKDTFNNSQEDLFFNNYLATTISEFNDINTNHSKDSNLIQKFDYCHTFDEKVEFHINGQRNLSFSMLKNFWLSDQWVINPFATHIHNGTQLLLIDKYNNEFMFTVNNIDYTIKEDNIIYNVKCQDSFSYQMIRQNAGYSIINDPESEDFIGAKEIDWWVLKHIQPECHINYNYIPLSQGVYIDKNNNVRVFMADEKLQNVRKILKKPYNLQEHKEFFNSIAFSINNSNASAALIALGESLGLMLNTCEHAEYNTEGNISNQFNKLFWYEPQRKEDFNGLYYSPYNNIQNFSFSHKGDALTTILNVQSNNEEDQVISLIPEITPFFMSLFSSKKWEDDNNVYTDNYFTSICQHNILTNDDIRIDQNIKTTDKGIFIKIMNKNKLTFRFDKNYNKCSFYYDTLLSSLNDIYDITNTQWQFYIGPDPDPKSNSTLSEKNINPIIINPDEIIPSELLNIDLDNVYIKISGADNGQDRAPKLVLNFYRDATAEDLEFAYIADRCPWLENKVINFSYFYNQKIINKYEYQSLLNIFKNDLRIANGQLILYTQDYFNAVSEKTKILANITNSSDIISAAFHADVIDTFAKTGKVEDISSFHNTYYNYLDIYFNQVKPNKVLDYNKILDSYILKYINAQQRFLKNIYDFTKLFNEKINFGSGNIEVTNYKINLNCDQNATNYITFDANDKQIVDPNFSKYDKNTGVPYVTLYQNKNGHQSTITTINALNAHNYIRRKKTQEQEGTRIETSSYWSPQADYYKLVLRGEKVKGKIKDIIKVTTASKQLIYFQLFKEDKDFVYYQTVEPERNNNLLAILGKVTNIQDSHGQTYSLWYELVDKNELINEFLYAKIYNLKYSTDTENKEKWYSEEKNHREQVSNWLNKTEGLFLLQYKLNKALLLNSFTNEDYKDKRYQTLKDYKESHIESKKLPKSWKEAAWTFYINHFPINNLYVKSPVYIKQPYEIKYKVKIDEQDTIQTIKCDYQRINESGKTNEEYLEYLKNPSNFVEEIKNPYLYQKEFQIPLVNCNNENKFYRRVTTANTETNCEVNNLYNDPLGILEENNWQVKGLSDKDFFNKDLPIDKEVEGYQNFNTVYYAQKMNSYTDYRNINEHLETYDYIGNITCMTNETLKTNTVPSTDHTFTVANWTEKKNIEGQEQTVYKSIDIAPPKDEYSHAYFNYYSLIAHTYNSIKEENLSYKDSWLRLVPIDEKINPKNSYKILILSKNNMPLVFNENNIPDDFLQSTTKGVLVDSFMTRWSRNIWFAIDAAAKKIIFEDYYKNSTIQAAIANLYGLNNVTSESNNPYILNIKQSEGKTLKVIILSEESYDYVDLLKSFKPIDKNDPNQYGISTDNRKILYTKDIIHLEKITKGIDLTQVDIKNIPSIRTNFNEIDFDRLPDLTLGFYTVKAKDPVFEKDFHFNLQDQDYLYFTPDKKEQIYTIEDLKKLNNTYYFVGNTKEIVTLNANQTTLPCKIFLHNSINEIIEYPKMIDLDITSNNPQSLSITYKGINYSTNYTVKKEILEEISNLNNGNFWYNYSHSNIEALQNQAILIETELSNYWEQAVAASKYCEYFIPDHWQLNIDGATNYFNNYIFNIHQTKIELNNQVIPEVQIYKDNNSTSITEYQFKHLEPQSSLFSTNDLLLDKEEFKNASFLKNNIVYKNIFNTLGIDIAELSVTPIGKTTLYYSKVGGMKWNTVLPTLSKIKYNYSYFNGLYIMYINLLTNYFVNQPIPENYKKALDKHNSIWTKIYHDYPNVILENTYSNTEAVNSKDLFNFATAYLKDLSHPEYNYNVTLIDSAKLDNYQGQEINIGDVIKLKADEFYDEFDDIKVALTKPLFITDLSYKLRENNNIQITVNTLKYQDKLIQRLVKLMK